MGSPNQWMRGMNPQPTWDLLEIRLDNLPNLRRVPKQVTLVPAGMLSYDIYIQPTCIGSYVHVYIEAFPRLEGFPVG